MLLYGNFCNIIVNNFHPKMITFFKNYVLTAEWILFKFNKTVHNKEFHIEIPFDKNIYTLYRSFLQYLKNVHTVALFLDSKELDYSIVKSDEEIINELIYQFPIKHIIIYTTRSYSELSSLYKQPLFEIRYVNPTTLIWKR
jgi:hypothetical protein